MKKILLTATVSVCCLALATIVWADQLTTTLHASVSPFTSFSLIDNLSAYRSTDTITFKTVDGTSPSGWYYNNQASLDVDGDPDDSRADVGLGVQSNTPFTVKIKKSSDALNGKVGYNVDKAYNWNGSASVEVGTVYPGSGFAGTLAADKWGAVTTSDVLIFDADSAYQDFSMGVSFALVPGNMAVGSYSTVITYTMVATP